MRREEVAAVIEEKLAKLGVPPHCVCIKRVPARVELSFVAGGTPMAKQFRSGITRPELDLALKDIELFVNEHIGGRDIQEAIATT